MDVVLKGFPDLEDKLKINFVTPVDKNLLCRLCLCLTPQLKRDNGLHGFCSSCFELLLDEDGLLVCDIEKKKYAQDKIFVDDIEQYVDGLRVRCPKNCGEQVMTFSRFKDHYRNCGSEGRHFASKVQPYAVRTPVPFVHCPLCGTQFPPAALIQHCKEQCPERILNCSDCKADYKGGKLQEHLAECEMRQQPCPNCGQNIPFICLSEHERFCIINQQRQDALKVVSHREEPRSFSTDERRQDQLGTTDALKLEIEKLKLQIEGDQGLKQVVQRLQDCYERTIAELNEKITELQTSQKETEDITRNLENKFQEEERKRKLRDPLSTERACAQCEKIFPANGLINHMKNFCPKRIIQCGRCSSELYADDLEAHLESDCEHHPFRCTLCRMDIARSEKEKHVSYCITRNTRCEGCGKGIPNSNYKSHLSKCPEVTLQCENCSSKHLRRNVQVHKKECPGWQCDDCKTYVKDVSKAEHFQKCPGYFTLCPYCKQYESKKCVENHLETCNKNPHLGNNATQGNQGEEVNQLNHYQTGKHTSSPERKCAEREIAEIKEKLKKTEAKAKDAEKLEHENAWLKQEVDSLKTKLHENQTNPIWENMRSSTNSNNQSSRGRGSKKGRRRRQAGRFQ